MDQSRGLRVIGFDEGWEFFQQGISKLENILEGSESEFSSEDYLMLYTTVYNMCAQKPPYDHSQRLYDKYRETFEEYLSSKVLPSLQEDRDHQSLLRDFVKRWSNHKIMVRWMSRFFHILDRYFIARRALPSLTEVGFNCFRDMVYANFKERVRDAVLFLIHQEREGEQIDRVLVKNVIDIFVQTGMDYYVTDFEEAMIEETVSYYSRKASMWISEDPSLDISLKVEQHLEIEKERVSHYLHSSTETQLLERVRQAILAARNS